MRRIFWGISVLLVLASCNKNLVEIPPVAPIEVVTDEINVLNDSSLEVISRIISVGEGIIEYGHQYGINPNDFSSITEKGERTDPIIFRDTIPRVNEELSYYVRAYARDRNREFVSNPISFIPEIVSIDPIVETGNFEVLAFNDLTNNYPVSVNGTIPELGSLSISEHGHEWSSTPTFNDVSRSRLGPTDSTGSFTSVLENLEPGETYYVRAYVENESAIFTGKRDTIEIGNVWVRAGVNSSQIPPRSNAVSFTINNKAYVGMGEGLIFNEFLTDFWEYDPVNDSWRRIADFPGKPRDYPLAFSLNNYGFVGTGDTLNYAFGDIWRYDPLANTWSQELDLEIPITKGFSFKMNDIVQDGQLFSEGVYLIGCTQEYFSSPSNRTAPIVFVYWDQVENKLDTRSLCDLEWCKYDAAINIGKSIYLITDVTPQGGDMWKLEITPGNCGQELLFQEFTQWNGGRLYSTSFVIDSIGYIGLGIFAPSQNSFFPYKDFFTFNHNTQNLGEFYPPEFPGEARWYATSFSLGRRGYVGLGKDIGFTPLSDFWKYIP